MRVRPCALLGAALALNLTALLSAVVATPALAAGEPQAAAVEPGDPRLTSPPISSLLRATI